MLTGDLIDRVFRGLEDARDIARVRCVCKAFYVSGRSVASMRYVCREIDHENARRKTTAATSAKLAAKSSESDEGDDDDDASASDSHNKNLSDGFQRDDAAEDIDIDDDDEGPSYANEGKKLSETGDDFSGTPDVGVPEYMEVDNRTDIASSSHQTVVSNVQESWKGKGIDEEWDESLAVTHVQGQDASSEHDFRVEEPVLIPDDAQGESSNTAAVIDGSNSSNRDGSSPHRKHQEEGSYIPFRQAVEQDLRTKPQILQLRIEIESKLQSKSVPAEERERSDFWLSDPVHLYGWVPSVSHSLQHLCIVDYGHQAIMRVSPILKILSQYCKNLKTIDLRNMFIDTKECAEMPELTSFTLRCVKINGNALNDFSDKMKNLQTLALLGVFGIGISHLSLQHLKILCLGLSTKAKTVTMDLPSLLKLQLKMACPEELTINAPALKFVAFNLEVRENLMVKFVNIRILQELLYGASRFVSLSELVTGNRLLNKLFLDIPCMALGEDGRWLGVLREVPLNIPSFKKLRVECPNLEVLNIGPGLWHSMESDIEAVNSVERWPRVRTLILQMIPQKLETSVAVLKTLLREMADTLINLEIYVHTTSPVNSNEFFEGIQNLVQHLSLKQKQWTKSLDFSCFTF